MPLKWHCLCLSSRAMVEEKDLTSDGKGKFRINCQNISAGLTEFQQFSFHHKPLHVRERYLYRVRLETCVVWAPRREWSSILLVENSEYTTLGFTRHTKEEDAGGKKNKALLSFLNYSCPGGMLSLLCFCQLTHVQVRWWRHGVCVF